MGLTCAGGMREGCVLAMGFWALYSRFGGQALRETAATAGDAS